jgi:hypothetical protein
MPNQFGKARNMLLHICDFSLEIATSSILINEINLRYEKFNPESQTLFSLF